MSGGELFLIFFFILLFFGADKIPEFARMLGKAMREFRKATDDIKSELNNSGLDIRKDFEDIKSDITDATSVPKQTINDIKEDLNKHVNS